MMTYLRDFYNSLKSLAYDLTVYPIVFVVRHRERCSFFTFERFNEEIYDVTIGAWYAWVLGGLFAYYVPYAWIPFLVGLVTFVYFMLFRLFILFPRNRCGYIKRIAMVLTKDGRLYNTTVWQPRYTCGEKVQYKFRPAMVRFYVD